MRACRTNDSRFLSESAPALSGFTIDQTNLRLVIDGYPRVSNPARLAEHWISLAREQGLEKIWLWTFDKDVAEFQASGFVEEGRIPEDSYAKPTVILAHYLRPERGRSEYIAEEDILLRHIQEAPVRPLSPLPEGLRVAHLSPVDSPAISRLMQAVFASYPTPVDDPRYIAGLMEKGCHFAGVFDGEELVSMAAAYPDKRWQRCEITDCATLDGYRGLSLTERLIGRLEPLMLHWMPFRFYTLARARSYGINRTFFKLGYRFCGRLINNCHIAGGYEDMNLWVRLP
ncbi:putative beta-lysine N-acetyltransferase [Heliobacterium undosum]|uniref:Putative beta-lysine N-acetyltransferase n=1 Tax=Heliomicrobium undosum TaxID=121734 RepID=A0A845L4H8_9FIRM|nr:putative beta-lysine N-acetyltransferase [Heliomicrobium undosum]MZP31203.1 putative beta-lysine N-acetyltransferase [Heliomicrobium undosum]